ncbi:MAG: hypothetical protein RL693_369, partial [Verrucomicrobiota bacterium]
MKRIMRFLLVFIFSVSFCFPNASAAPSLTVNIPDNGRDMFKPDSNGGSRPALPKEPGIASAQEVSTWGVPFSKAWQFDIAQQPEKPWSVMLGAPVIGAINKGDKCLLVFFARALEGKATGTANIEIKIAPKYAKVGSTGFTAGKDWVPVVFRFEARESGEDGKIGLSIHLGTSKQKLEIGGLRLLNYGPDFALNKLPTPYIQYEGRESDASWRKEAEARIEKYRMGNFSIKAVDAQGKPLPDALIHAVLKRHDFGFGSAVTASLLSQDTPDGVKYRSIVSECFSRVVFENDLKPFAWEAAKDPNTTGSFRKAYLDHALGWLAEKNIGVRGHYLCWAPFEPWSTQLKDNPQAIREKVFAYMAEVLPAVGKRVQEWDALNHPAGWEANGCINTVLGDGFYTEVFREARKHTELPLWINEDQVMRPGRQQEDYYKMIKKLLADGVKIDGIGNQAHFDSSFLPSPREIMENSDRFAALAPALQITEFDVTTNGDEGLAADFTRDILTTCFSHPAYTGFVMWGFWEGAHWKPETALWRKDWSE